MREIFGYARICREKGLGGVREIVEAGNLAFKQEITEYVTAMWNNNELGYPIRVQWPWRLSSQLTNANQNIRHSIMVDSPGYPGNSGSSINNQDFARYRVAVPSPGDSFLSSAEAFVIGSIGALDVETKSNNLWCSNLMSLTDVPTTQLGNTFVHPVFVGTATVTSASPWLTSLSFTGTSATFPSNWFQSGYADNASVVRIESGPDKGVYYVVDVDRQNSRLSLRTPDGAAFNPQTTQSSLSISIGVRPAFFNEVSVIPNGTGQVAFSGLFNPGVNNNSYICKVHFEKSGSPTAGDSRQIGSYWFSLKAWTFGDGILGTSNQEYYEDSGQIWNGRNLISATTNGATFNQHGFNFNFQNWGGGCGGIVFDQTNQRMWFITSDGTNGDICYWLYKTPESAHEVASTGGAPQDPALTPAPSLTGVFPNHIQLGSDNTVYVCLSTTTLGSNEPTAAGLLAISPSFGTTVARTTTEWAFGVTSHFYGHTIDTTRARTGTAGDATTTVAGHITSTSGAFTNKDLGRLIKITGNSADNGTYLISAVNSTTDVSVTLPTGGAVSFTGGSGGTFQIGDRIYLFWNDTVTVSNKIYYVESLAITILLSFTVTLTNGKKIEVSDRIGGSHTPACVDPATSVLYWATQDTAVQLNRYDPASGTYNHVALSTFNGLNGGSGSQTNPAVISALAVNPLAAFRELWIATDQGQIKIGTLDSQVWTAPTWTRYYGSSDTPPYSQPTNVFKSAGSTNAIFAGNNGYVRVFQFGIDGRVWGLNVQVNNTNGYQEIVAYNRDSDNWTPSGGNNNDFPVSQTQCGFFCTDPYGGGLFLVPYVSNSTCGMVLNGASIHYQWSGSAWFPQEVVRGAVPDSVSSPGLAAKPLHTAAAALVMGVQVAFTPQGGATPPNNEFLGRLGQVIGYGGNDGATDSITGITHTFTGSGFSSSDVGRLLRVESGTAQGVFAITAFTNTTTVSIRKYSNVSYTGSNETGLTYTVWDQNSQSNAGPEQASIYWANGFGKDNTQDINNIYYDFFLMKTLLSEQVESIKFCTPTLGPAGTGTSVFFEYLARSTAQYEPGVPNMRATPATGVQSGDGTQLLDNMIDKQLIGTHGHASAYSSGGDGGWFGAPFSDGNNVQGNAFVFDLGKAVQVGSILVRGVGASSAGVLNTDTENGNGLIAVWMNELTAGTSPANASTVRFSGSNLNITFRNTTISLTSGDFTGSVIGGFPRSVGSITIGGNTLVDAPGTFTPPVSGNPGNYGQILQVTSSIDAGFYRIIAVSSDGSTITIRNLNQTAYAWLSTESGTLSYQIKDGVQEGDMVVVTTGGHTQNRLGIERLLTTTTAQVRVTPNETVTALAWNCVKPTWTTVKRVEYSVQGVPPEVTNNGTWMSEDGAETETGTNNNINSSFKIFAQFNDLPVYQATGRYWKLAMMPRFNANQITSDFYLCTVTFLDPSGNYLGQISYNMLDTVTSQPNFLAGNIYRGDFIQASDYGTTQISNTNGLANLGGATGNTVTLATAGNAFLGFQVRPAGASGSAAGGNNIFACLSSDPNFNTSDVTRFLNIQSGPNAGYYRILAFTDAQHVTVTTPSGGAVTLSADAGPTPFTVHEGINVGTSTPDYICFSGTDFRSGGNSANIAEYSIATISNDLKTLTLNVPQYMSLSNQHWEIRRRASADSTDTGTNSALTARAIYGFNTYPVQPGDLAQDSKGFVRFWADDCGNGNQRTNGQTSITGNTFTGTGFTPDDVGRVLVIKSGSDINAYKISAYISTTQVTVINAFTGATVSFAATASSLTYVVYGDRRFRLSRYTTVLRA